MRLARPTLMIVLFLAGATLAVWLMAVAPSTRPASLTLWIVLAAACAGAVPPIANRVVDGSRRIGHLSPSDRRRVTIVIWAAATLYLAATAWFHARDLFPRVHDEQSYTIGARMLARGRLWMPQHPLAEFFESFHVFVHPVYSSIYFPGTALMNVPGIWFGLPSWVVPVVAAGLVVALTYRVTAELVDDMTGLLAALMVVCTGWFRVLSTMVMSQTPVALLGLLVVWAWLHWRKDRRARWAVLIGAFAGWAAITRPVDAAAFAVPVGLAMVIDAVSSSGSLSRYSGGGLGRGFGPEHGPRKPPPQSSPGVPGEGERLPLGPLARAAIALLVGAAPFLALQLIFDLGVTGRPFKTPYVLYLEQNQPGSTFGSMPSTQPALPATTLQQKQAYFSWLVQDEQANRHQGWRYWLAERLRPTCVTTLPSVIFLPLLVVGLMGLGGRRWVVAATIPLFLGLYLLNPFYLAHYPVPLIPPIAFLAAVGVHVILNQVQGERRDETPSIKTVPWRTMTASSILVGIVVLCLRATPELNPANPSPEASITDRGVSDEVYALPQVTLAHGPLLEAVHAPAVILFRYRLGVSPDDEPVYNSDVAWPDDAPVIRAQDLGERNAELFRYYADRQPARRFYLFDRGDDALYDLGTAQQALRPEVLKGQLGQPIQKFGPGEPGR